MDKSIEGSQELLGFAEDLLRKAGKLALKYYGRGNPLIKFDDELVAEADVGIRNLIRDSISKHYPEHSVLGEGADRTTYQHGERGFQWVMDPVDGTANFQAGIPIWAISLALFDNFWPILGVCCLPVTRDCYKALAGDKLFFNDAPVTLEPEVVASDESVLLTYSRFHTEFRSSFPGKVRNLGCAGAHLGYVATGRAEAALLKYVHIWDLAAGLIILEAAGGEIRYLDGRSFHINDYLDGQKVEEPLLAAPAGEHSVIAQYLQPV